MPDVVTLQRNWNSSYTSSISQKLETTSEWVNKLQEVHTTEYYSAIKRKELLMYTAT